MTLLDMMSNDKSPTVTLEYRHLNDLSADKMSIALQRTPGINTQHKHHPLYILTQHVHTQLTAYPIIYDYLASNEVYEHTHLQNLL